jgi:hypothetical protein
MQQYTPASFKIIDNQIVVQNGRNGIMLSAPGGQSAFDFAGGSTTPITGTATAVNTAHTTHTGSQSLPTGTIDVASTNGFARAGFIYAHSSGGFEIVNYTGISPTSFTGSSGSTGTLSAKADVFQTQVTDTGQAWTANDIAGLGVQIGNAQGTIVQNDATHLLLAHPNLSIFSGWVDPLGTYDDAGRRRLHNLSRGRRLRDSR